MSEDIEMYGEYTDEEAATYRQKMENAHAYFLECLAENGNTDLSLSRISGKGILGSFVRFDPAPVWDEPVIKEINNGSL